jgi:hypothetical protein
MGKATKVPEKPTFKVRLRVDDRGHSTIIRNEGLPFIEDKTDKAVIWLAANGFKENEIEIIGKKPACWDAVFSPPVVEATVEAPEAPVA